MESMIRESQTIRSRHWRSVENSVIERMEERKNEQEDVKTQIPATGQASQTEGEGNALGSYHATMSINFLYIKASESAYATMLFLLTVLSETRNAEMHSKEINW